MGVWLSPDIPGLFLQLPGSDALLSRKMRDRALAVGRSRPTRAITVVLFDHGLDPSRQPSDIAANHPDRTVILLQQ
jgi:hypothetical protein